MADDNDDDFDRLSDTLSGALPSDYYNKKVYMRTYCDNNYCDLLSPDRQEDAGNRARADVVATIGY